MRETQNPYAVLIALLAAMWLAIGLIAVCYADDSDLKPDECWIEKDYWIDDKGDKQIELNIYCTDPNNPGVFDIVEPKAV
jgi:hypothetical protein